MNQSENEYIWKKKTSKAKETRLLTLLSWTDRRCPWTSNRHRHRIRIPLVRTFCRGNSCSTTRLRVQRSLCCLRTFRTFLKLFETENAKKQKLKPCQVKSDEIIRRKWVKVRHFLARCQDHRSARGWRWRLIDGETMRKLTAFEASFVIFVSSSDALFSGVDWFAALWALWVVCWLERHCWFGFVGFLDGMSWGFANYFAVNFRMIDWDVQK